MSQTSTKTDFNPRGTEPPQPALMICPT